MLNHINVEEVLYIDIETVPVIAEFSMLTPQWQKLWADKMKASISETVTAAEIYNRAGIYAEFGRIIVISMGYLIPNNDGMKYKVKSYYDADEKILLQNFTSDLEKFVKKGKKRLCAHNGQEFDFPWIARRMLVNGLAIPEMLNIGGSKPWENKDTLLDTLQLWKFGDFKHYTSLSLLCALFGIPTPKDDIDGSQVAQVYYVEQNIERIVHYCQKDTLAVANLLLRYKGMTMVMPENMQTV